MGYPALMISAPSKWQRWKNPSTQESLLLAPLTELTLTQGPIPRPIRFVQLTPKAAEQEWLSQPLPPRNINNHRNHPKQFTAGPTVKGDPTVQTVLAQASSYTELVYGVAKAKCSLGEEEHGLGRSLGLSSLITPK